MTHPLLRPQPLRAWQFEDLLDTPDDGYRYEIFDGTLLVTPTPPMAHFATLYRLRRLLEAQAPSHLVVGENLGVLRRDANSYFIPDLVIFDADLLSSSVAALPPAAAKLVVEVVSPSNPSTDLVLKRAGYAMVGVAEYWIVEPSVREVQVLGQPGPEGYLIQEKHTGLMSSTVPFPYELDLNAIFI